MKEQGLLVWMLKPVGKKEHSFLGKARFAFYFVGNLLVLEKNQYKKPLSGAPGKFKERKAQLLQRKGMLGRN